MRTEVCRAGDCGCRRLARSGRRTRCRRMDVWLLCQGRRRVCACRLHPRAGFM